MIQIGAYTFPDGQAQATVCREEALSRVRKSIRIDAILGPFDSINEALAMLDDLEGQLALLDIGLADVRIQADRFHMAHRKEYERAVDERTLTASVHIVLLTEDAFERGVQIESHHLNIADGETEIIISQAGNIDALPVLTVQAQGVIINPTVTDGQRTWTYMGTLSPGDALVVDSDQRTAILNGTVNVLNRAAGDFIRLYPDATRISWSEDVASSQQATLTIQYRSLWD